MFDNTPDRALSHVLQATDTASAVPRLVFGQINFDEVLKASSSLMPLQAAAGASTLPDLTARLMNPGLCAAHITDMTDSAAAAVATAETPPHASPANCGQALFPIALEAPSPAEAKSTTLTEPIAPSLTADAIAPSLTADDLIAASTAAEAPAASPIDEAAVASAASQLSAGTFADATTYSSTPANYLTMDATIGDPAHGPSSPTTPAETPAKAGPISGLPAYPTSGKAGHPPGFEGPSLPAPTKQANPERPPGAFANRSPAPVAPIPGLGQGSANNEVT